ncbi:MAG: response regulator [Oscillatoria sp. PMC 1068.18]|nr:response regulator [Oscillatoria sp. PMC 1076.18]MEC4991203.1 response regulator [Oscillatoria sp. PMC 1068.18]
MKILLVEDDNTLAEVIKETLIEQHYLLDEAVDGQVGWELAKSYEYDLILLDLILPKLDGISFCQELRRNGDRTPILLMTAYDNSTRKIAGLDAGADDYLVKPFDFQELLARIRALLRRGNDSLPPVLKWGNLALDPANCTVTYDTEALHLTAKEYALLELFLRNPQRIFSQSALLDRVWDWETFPSENAVRTQVKSLRQKLKKAGAAKDLIETVYGLGYRLREGELQSPQLKQIEPEAKESVTTNKSRLQKIWERNQDQYRDRVAIVVKAAQKWQENNLSETLRKEAFHQLHTLKGSLGCFGLKEISNLCEKIEKSFQFSANLTAKQVKQLAELINTLQQHLEEVDFLASEKLHSASLLTFPKLRKKNSDSHRILVISKNANLNNGLREEAKSLNLGLDSTKNLTQARIFLAQKQPDLVLLDLELSDSSAPQLDFLAELEMAQPPIPTIVLTAEDSFNTRLQVARLGAKICLHQPITPTQIIANIKNYFQQDSLQTAKIIIVDDDRAILSLLCQFLEPWGFEVTSVDDPRQFWSILPQINPDLVILDLEMPNLSGIDLCQVVRNDPQWQNLPLLFLLGDPDTVTIKKIFAVGGDDYIPKPIIEPELMARVLNHLKKTETLHKFTRSNYSFPEL